MRDRYLEVTFRKGKPFAAYLYLPRTRGEKSATTRAMGRGLRVDFSAKKAPIGVEIVDPSLVTAKALNAVLDRLGLPRLAPGELAPLRAA